MQRNMANTRIISVAILSMVGAFSMARVSSALQINIEDRPEQESPLPFVELEEEIELENSADEDRKIQRNQRLRIPRDADALELRQAERMRQFESAIRERLERLDDPRGDGAERLRSALNRIENRIRGQREQRVRPGRERIDGDAGEQLRRRHHHFAAAAEHLQAAGAEELAHAARERMENIEREIREHRDARGENERDRTVRERDERFRRELDERTDRFERMLNELRNEVERLRDELSELHSVVRESR